MSFFLAYKVPYERSRPGRGGRLRQPHRARRVDLDVDVVELAAGPLVGRRRRVRGRHGLRPQELLAELDAATASTHPLLVDEPAPGKSWARAVALPLFILAAAIGHGVPVLRGPPAPVVVNATYGYAEPAVEPPSPAVVALRAFVDATPRRCASAPSAPSCRTDNLPDMPLGAWFRAAH